MCIDVKSKGNDYAKSFTESVHNKINKRYPEIDVRGLFFCITMILMKNLLV